eukprot:202061-Chlamydomonas_euryale.AAC.2
MSVPDAGTHAAADPLSLACVASTVAVLLAVFGFTRLHAPTNPDAGTGSVTHSGQQPRKRQQARPPSHMHTGCSK